MKSRDRRRRPGRVFVDAAAIRRHPYGGRGLARQEGRSSEVELCGVWVAEECDRSPANPAWPREAFEELGSSLPTARFHYTIYIPDVGI